MKSMSLGRSIFATLLAFSLVVVVAFAVLASLVLYNSYEKNEEDALVSMAEGYAEQLSAETEADVLAAQLESSIRVTLIDADGQVLFDSVAEGELENHADRPEVKEAQESGEAVSSRYSQTVGTDLLYAAVRLDDGRTLRLAEVRESFASYMGDVAVPLAALLVLVVVAVWWVSRWLSRRIIAPINAIDVGCPLKSDIYTELRPLLVHIDDQHALMQEQNAVLEAAENMRREFSANVSHEMKTPLTVISGYAELLRENVAKPEDREKFAGLIYDEAQEMRALIDDVLTISRLEEAADGTRADEPVDLHQAALAVQERIGDFARNSGVDLSVEGEAAFVLGSPVYTQQLVYNLVDNGIRYNHEGGSVLVRTGCDEAGRPRLVVKDTGAGIPMELRDKIFERFYRVDESHSKATGGTGLGLAIVKHAVQYQGGTVEMHSVVGKGTEFTVTFPAVEDRRAQLARHAGLRGRA